MFMIINMKTNEFEAFISKSKLPVFTLTEAANIIGKPKHYASIFLSRNRHIKRAERGIYYTRDATEYEVASRIIAPSYISLVSALRFHNLTEQIPRFIYVLSFKRHREIKNLNGYKVIFKVVKKSLMFGYSNVDGVYVASPEKAVIDMFYLGEFVEYAEEAIESKKLNIGGLLKYAKATKDARLIKKINEAVEKYSKK
jgi:predicted transcriptional regulator of viral defense system